MIDFYQMNEVWYSNRVNIAQANANYCFDLLQILFIFTHIKKTSGDKQLLLFVGLSDRLGEKMLNS